MDDGRHITVCELCNGTGLVTCYHPLDVKAARLGVNRLRDPRSGGAVKCGARDDGSATWGFADVPCKCTRGDKFALWFSREAEPRRMPRFQESAYHVRPVLREGRYDLVEDVEESKAPVEWDYDNDAA